MTHINEHVKHVVDVVSVTTVVGTLTAWLPPIAAALSIIWTSLRLYEMLSGRPLNNKNSGEQNGKIQ